jgi:hypothetical protein
MSKGLRIGSTPQGSRSLLEGGNCISADLKEIALIIGVGTLSILAVNEVRNQSGLKMMGIIESSPAEMRTNEKDHVPLPFF